MSKPKQKELPVKFESRSKISKEKICLKDKIYGRIRDELHRLFFETFKELDLELADIINKNDMLTVSIDKSFPNFDSIIIAHLYSLSSKILQEKVEFIKRAVELAKITINGITTEAIKKENTSLVIKNLNSLCMETDSLLKDLGNLLPSSNKTPFISYDNKYGDEIIISRQVIVSSIEQPNFPDKYKLIEMLNLEGKDVVVLKRNEDSNISNGNDDLYCICLLKEMTKNPVKTTDKPARKGLVKLIELERGFNYLDIKLMKNGGCKLNNYLDFIVCTRKESNGLRLWFGVHDLEKKRLIIDEDYKSHNQCHALQFTKCISNLSKKIAAFYSSQSIYIISYPEHDPKGPKAYFKMFTKESLLYKGQSFNFAIASLCVADIDKENYLIMLQDKENQTLCGFKVRLENETFSKEKTEPKIYDLHFSIDITKIGRFTSDGSDKNETKREILKYQYYPQGNGKLLVVSAKTKLGEVKRTLNVCLIPFTSNIMNQLVVDQKGILDFDVDISDFELCDIDMGIIDGEREDGGLLALFIQTKKMNGSITYITIETNGAEKLIKYAQVSRSEQEAEYRRELEKYREAKKGGLVGSDGAEKKSQEGLFKHSFSEFRNSEYVQYISDSNVFIHLHFSKFY